jgi:raffinose/stachyose/melibiose transport system substrate-binding protein
MMKNTLIHILGAASLLALMAGAASAEQVTLDVTAWKGNETEPAGLKDIIAKFEAANPDIKVQLSYVSRSDTDVVLPPRLQGNNPPDVMMADMVLIKVWGDAGLLADFGADAPWLSHVIPGLRDVVTRNGKTYVMPLEVIGLGMFTNMGLLGKAGIERPPLTIDELKDACGKLDAAGIKPMMMGGDFPSTLFVVANGLDAATTPVADLGSGASKFVDDAGFNATLDTFRDLEKSKCFDAKVMAGVDPWSTGLSEFKAGNYAMMAQGAWNIASFSESKDLDFTFGPIPSTSPNGVALDLFGFGWSVSANAKHKEAAVKFVDFFGQPENLKPLLDAEAAYSPYDDGASGTPELAANYDAARAANAIRNYPFAVLDLPGPVEQEVKDSLVGLLANTEMTNADVLSRWDQTVEDNQ